MAIKSAAGMETSFQSNSTSYTIGTQLSGEIFPVLPRLSRFRPQFGCSEPDVERVKDSLKRHDSWKKVSHHF